MNEPDYNTHYYVISEILGTDLYLMQNAGFCKMTVVCRRESTNNNS